MLIPSFLANLPRAVRHHPWRTTAIVVPVALIAFAVYGVTRPAVPELIVAQVERKDIAQLIEAVGTVTSDRDLELQFPTSGIIAAVSLKEGDRVAQGQMIASLRNADLRASVASQVANLDYAKAQLKALQDGTRPEDIAVAQADLLNKKAALEAAKSTLTTSENNLTASKQKLETLEMQAEISLSGQVSLARSTITEQLLAAESALGEMDDVFAQIKLSDALTRSAPDKAADLRSLRLRAGDALVAAQSATLSASSDYRAALDAFQTSRAAIVQTSTVLTQAYNLISSIPELSTYTAADREADKASVSAQRSAVQNVQTTLDTSVKSLQDASASFDTQIQVEQNTITASEGTRDRAKADILTYESAVRISEAQLESKQAPARQADIASAEARVRQASADVARASAQVGNTILTAPVAGIITKVNIKAGEALPAGPAVTMLGDSPMRIEMFVSEIDIPKVVLSQSGVIVLDAFPATRFKLNVSAIDPGVTDKDGVSKYRVMLDFVHRHDTLKIGMTGDAEVISAERKQVLTIPRRAVLDRPTGEQYVRVQKDTLVEERLVTLGIDGADGEIEIVTGLQEGETVIVLEKK